MSPGTGAEPQNGTLTEPEGTGENGHPPGRRLLRRYSRIRKQTEDLTASLETEDFVIQVDEHVSPVKWHLAHTSWFFETFLLKEALKDYRRCFPQYDYLFNSYYLQTGVPHCRDRRGNLSRPTVKEVFRYRKYIDEQVLGFLESADTGLLEKMAPVIELGLHHEQQHQELLLTDLKYMFAANPLWPVYTGNPSSPAPEVPPLSWSSFTGGLHETGHTGEGFGYDNEFPRHKSWLEDYRLANRLVTNGEYLEFMEAGGYSDSRWWLDEGFATAGREEWQAPLYWVLKDDEWHHYTLGGLKRVEPGEPVCHVSYYEADAFARWAGCRLPAEHEWEAAAGEVSLSGNFLEEGRFHPAAAAKSGSGLQQLFGDVWEWTRSPYSPYPGFEPLPGALGEYNGKFMCNQFVLRGGSCVTSRTHIRRTYRNFFHPDARWQFTGIRLADDQ